MEVSRKRKLLGRILILLGLVSEAIYFLISFSDGEEKTNFRLVFTLIGAVLLIVGADRLGIFGERNPRQ